MENPIKVSEKLFMVIEILAEHGAHGLLELSTKMKLHKSTIHRLLKSLIFMNYVKQDKETGKYNLTLKLVGISNSILKQIDILEVVRPYLKKLSENTGETVHLVKFSNNEAIYIDKVQSIQNSVRMVSKVGKVVPIFCSAVGKAFIAQMNEDEITERWQNSKIEKLTKHTITDFEDFKKEISTVKKVGYALDNEENELGVRCIGIAFYDYKGNYSYALSISAPINRMSDKKIKEFSKYIKNTKKEIEKEMSKK